MFVINSYSRRTCNMEKKNIDFKWIEKGKKEPKKQISITAEEENGQLKLVEVKCFPGIICLTCGPLRGGQCPNMA
jgi:hypothetical protein